LNLSFGIQESATDPLSKIMFLGNRKWNHNLILDGILATVTASQPTIMARKSQASQRQHRAQNGSVLLGPREINKTHGEDGKPKKKN
jgi:hypothetical protein